MYGEVATPPETQGTPAQATKDDCEEAVIARRSCKPNSDMARLWLCVWLGMAMWCAERERGEQTYGDGELRKQIPPPPPPGL